MRSFIKSHKRASSLDESPTRAPVSPTRMGRQGDYLASQKIFEDPPMFGATTPPRIAHNGTGTKHSPSFESLQKFANKKMFTTKLFKKNTSSTAQPQASGQSGSHHELSNTPDTPSRNLGLALEGSHFKTDERTIPAIKGTITHNWGDNADKGQSVIILNHPSEVDSINSQDLEPAVRITSLRRGSAISAQTAASYENTLPRTMSNDDQSRRRSELARDKHVYNELCKVKSKNRQARIHSHDDIIHFEKASTVSLDLLESTVSPLVRSENQSLQDCIPASAGHSSKSSTQHVAEEKVSSDSRSSDVQEVDHLKFSVSFEDSSHYETENSRDSATEDEEDENSMLLTPEIDEEDDDTSKFSFELGGLNGRNSSVKYYSKPDPKETVYIDDVYDDEDFDESMNFYEDELPDNDFHHADEPFVVAPTTTNHLACSLSGAVKQLKTYNDLFELSDDHEDSESERDATESSQDTGFCADSMQESTLRHDDQQSLSRNSEGICFDNDSLVDSKSTVMSPTEKVPAKTVKSFSDIFDIDDDDDDDEESDNEDQNAWETELRNYSGNDNGASTSLNVSNTNKMARNVSANKRCQTSVFNDLPKDISKPAENYLNFSLDSADRPKTPIHIFVTPPVDPLTSSETTTNPHLSPCLEVAPLPPPARSQTLKIQDLNSNLDSEVPGLMSNLFFIDETEEDKYNERNKISDDEYLDEINTVPEDFNFSDSEHDMNSMKSPLRRSSKGSFRSTHSYSGQPIGAAKEATPTRNKLEIKNKTVTFFNYSGEPSSIERSPQPIESYSPIDTSDDYVISPIKNKEIFSPVTPSNSFGKPKPDYLNDYSLSPIQENSSSVDNSPSLPLQ